MQEEKKELNKQEGQERLQNKVVYEKPEVREVSKGASIEGVVYPDACITGSSAV